MKSLLTDAHEMIFIFRRHREEGGRAADTESGAVSARKCSNRMEVHGTKMARWRWHDEHGQHVLSEFNAAGPVPRARPRQLAHFGSRAQGIV